MRVNARLDETAQEQLHFLAKTTGQSMSHVLREAVAVYHRQVKQQQARPPSRFLALIGTGDSGRSDIASNVKAHVADIIQRKHGFLPLQPLPTPHPRQSLPPTKARASKAAAKSKAPTK